MHNFATTIPARLFAMATSFPDEVFLQQRQGESLKTWTYGDARKMVEEMRDDLLRQGFSRGDRIALLSENSREWIVIYFAIIAAGYVAVPLDSGMPLGDLCNILEASGSRVLFASEKFHAPICDTLSQRNIMLRVLRTDEILESSLRDVQIPELNPADIAVLIYTSGTTGHSKGVALTHDNLLANVESCALVCEIHQVDNFLLILPLHHTFACTVSLLLPMAMGARVTLATSYRSRDIIDDIRISKTTVLAAVPQLFDGMMNGILRAVDSAGKPKQILFALLRLISRAARFFGLKLGHSLFHSLRKRSGVDTVRLFVSGGAALPPETNRFFEELGMNLTPRLRHDRVQSGAIRKPCNEKQNWLGWSGASRCVADD
jgi:long-chain acyl-CoA synthetase